MAGGEIVLKTPHFAIIRAGSIRDLTFPWMYQIPYFRKEMAMTISGLKTGMFEQMSYQQVAQYTERDNTFSTKSESLPEYE